MQKQKHTRIGKMMIREQYVVTVRMKVTGHLAWAAGHGKWLVPPQAEGVFARAKKAAKHRPFRLFFGDVSPTLNDEGPANIDGTLACHVVANFINNPFCFERRQASKLAAFINNGFILTDNVAGFGTEFHTSPYGRVSPAGYQIRQKIHSHQQKPVRR
jgi:hypothetical protein